MAKKQLRPASLDVEIPEPRVLVQHAGPNRAQRRHGMWPKRYVKRFTVPRRLRLPAVNFPYVKPRAE